MAAIDKTLVPATAVPATVPATGGDVSVPAAPPPPSASPLGTPDLRRFSAITGSHAGAPRSILTRASVGYNGPIEVGNVRFASTEAALDQIIVENGAEGKLGLLQRAYDAIA